MSKSLDSDPRITAEYWDKYYGSNSHRNNRPIPSQFAAFVISEIQDLNARIIDFGCGNGRDSLFFSGHGIPTIGVDASKSAIDECNRKSSGPLAFICGSVGDESVLSRLTAELEPRSSGSLVLYSRFFVHAIDDTLEEAFLTLSNKLTKANDLLFLEFRTMRDSGQEKVTSAHYRRFVNPYDFIMRANTHGFRCDYFIEGFGYAKYKSDDAHVARLVLRRQ